MSLYLRKLLKRDIILFLSVESFNRSSVTEQHVIIKFQNDCLWLCIIFQIQQIITDFIVIHRIRGLIWV